MKESKGQNAGGKVSAWFKKINSSMSVERKMALSFGVILVAVILFWLGIFAAQTQPIDRFSFNNTTKMNGDLKEVGNQSIFTCELPEEFDDGQSVLFKCSHATIEVFLDGDVIYTFGEERPVVGKTPGTVWHVVDVPDNSAGCELVVVRTSVYSTYKGPDADFYFGSRGDCILKLVNNFFYVLIMNFVSIVLGLICLLLYLRTIKRKEMQVGSGFLWIGLFAIIIAIWSLRQSGFLRFLIPYSEILYFIDIHTLMLAAIPLDMFVRTISKTKWGKACMWFVPIYLFSAVFGTLMQVVGVFDLREMLTVMHVLIGVNAMYMFFAVHREAWKNKGSAASMFRIPLYTILVFGLMEIIYFYFPSRTTSIFLPTGVMLFILMLVWQQVSSYFHTLETQKLVYYEKFANTDMLTGALNRNAYETRLKHLVPEETDLTNYGAALFDLNDLKFINDNYGHEHGDDAIKRCYELIVTVFGDRSNCYRIGGDEFVYLGFNKDEIEQKMAYFDSLVARDRAELDYPFNVAFGYAVFDSEQDNNVHDTIKRSDAMMYLDKKEKKQQNNDPEEK